MKVSGWRASVAAGVLLAAAGAQQAAMAAPNQAEVCLPHTRAAQGDDDDKAMATDKTGINWIKKVSKLDGPSWANLPYPFPALCVQTAPDAPYKWHCVIVRKPCRMERIDLKATPPRPELQLGN